MDVLQHRHQKQYRDVRYLNTSGVFGCDGLNVSTRRTEGRKDSSTGCTTFQVIEGITNLTSVENDLIINQEDTILFGETETINKGQFLSSVSIVPSRTPN